MVEHEHKRIRLEKELDYVTKRAKDIKRVEHFLNELEEDRKVWEKMDLSEIQQERKLALIRGKIWATRHILNILHLEN